VDHMENNNKTEVKQCDSEVGHSLQDEHSQSLSHSTEDIDN
jgi:hypothetical protein